MAEPLPEHRQSDASKMAETPQPGSSKERALLETFRRFDMSGDGKIQMSEFRRLMKSLGDFSDKEIERLFKEADTDSSGAVDWQEFVRWICSAKVTEMVSSAALSSLARKLYVEINNEASFVAEAELCGRLAAFLRDSYPEREREREETTMRRRMVRARKLMTCETSQVRRDQVDDLRIPDSYTGYRLPIPVTQEGARGLLEHYLMNGESEPLHPQYVCYLTLEFANVYRRVHPKPVVELSTPKPGRLIIVGDTHGQLADVLHIMHFLGTPSAENMYLFNGDMVDRGRQGTEILMILFAFFLADNTCLVINRGNHENEDMNALDADSGGGFADEVIRKYGMAAYRRFVSAFKAMSLCAVVEKSIFVVHGGLPRVESVTIDYINTIDHGDNTSPSPLASSVKDNVFTDLLWADPTDNPGKFRSARGISIQFGPDVTTKFCMQNRLRFVIRSHQVPSDGRGFCKQHDGRCVTIFSASNYCGNGGNYGAVLVLSSDHFPRYEIYEHYAAPLEQARMVLCQGASAALSSEQRQAQQEAAVKARWQKELEHMIVSVIERKPALWAHVVDMSLGHLIQPNLWEDLMCDLVDANHPWSEAAEHWGLAREDGMVEMKKFLGRWVVTVESERYSSFLVNAVKRVFEALLSLDLDLEHTLKLFDVDGDGMIELKEVRQVLGMFDLGLTNSQLDRLTGQLFARCAELDDGTQWLPGSLKLKVQDFLGRFTVIYKQATECPGINQPKLDPWMVEALDAIARLIIRTPADQLLSDLEKAAVMIQKHWRGSYERKMSKALTPGTPTAPKRSKSWKVTLGSATKAFSFGSAISALRSNLNLRSGRGKAEPETLEPELQLTAMPKMVRLFSALDTDQDGVLEIDEFVSGIEKLPGVNELVIAGSPLTHDRLVAIAAAVDFTRNGTINYLEFLQAFETPDDLKADIGNTLAEDVTTVLFRHRVAIRMGCQYLDDAGCGQVPAEDFMKVLQGVNSALARPERPFTNTQIVLLADALQSTEDSHGGMPGTVDYDSFLRSFVIVDTEQGNAVVKRF